MDENKSLTADQGAAPTPLNKYLTMARRALDDNNFNDAKKFYEMASFEDTENIEASFYITLLGAFTETTQANVSIKVDALKKRVESCLVSLKASSSEERNGMLTNMCNALVSYSESCVESFSSNKKIAVSLLAHSAASAILHLGEDGINFATDLLYQRLFIIQSKNLFSSAELAEEYDFHKELYSKFDEPREVPSVIIASLTTIGRNKKDIGILKSLPKSERLDGYIAEIEKENEEKQKKWEKETAERTSRNNKLIITGLISAVLVIVGLIITLVGINNSGDLSVPGIVICALGFVIAFVDIGVYSYYYYK